MLAYFAEKIAEQAPTRNWDGPGACVDGEEEEIAIKAETVVLQDAWLDDEPKKEQAVAVALALRGAGTALLRAAYSNATVLGVISIQDRLSNITNNKTISTRNE